MSFSLVYSLQPWDNVGRVGEAKNPGPIVKLSTLNIVSASKNENIIVEDQGIASVQVFTETCMTKVTYETLCRRARASCKTLVPSALCNPRQNIIRGASYTRGQSGGVLAMSDLPTRPGNFTMPTATWASTRVVDAIVALTPDFYVSVLGIYGVTAKIKTHADLTNDLLVSTLGAVAQSSLPCVVVGYLNPG